MKRENEEDDNKRVRYNHNEDKIDRLSYLPEFVLILILSHLKAEDAVRTCILSSRWRHLWKHLPLIKLYSNDFTTVEGFVDFVKGILSRRRDFSVALRAIDFQYLGFNRTGYHHVFPDPELPETISTVIIHAASQNVNRLRLRFPGIFGGLISFPYSLFSSSSLTSLDMEFKDLLFPNSLNLPSLTFLKLSYLSLSNPCRGMIDPFSTYKSLNTLILYQCKIMDQKRLLISSSTLIKLSIHTPKCVQSYPQIVLSAPSLSTFDITCSPLQTLSGTHLSSIKQVRFDFEDTFGDLSLVYIALHNLRLLNFFLQMTNIESLIVFPTTLLFFHSVRKELKVKPPFLCNLKLLKVVKLYPNRHVSYVPAAGTMSWKENTKLQEAIQARLEPYSFIPRRVMDILLQNSPSATVEIIFEGYCSSNDEPEASFN